MRIWLKKQFPPHVPREKHFLMKTRTDITSSKVVDHFTARTDKYDDSREDSIRSMIHDFYNRKMLSKVILVWIYAIVFTGLMVFSGIKFFKTDQTQTQLMYAVIFIVATQFICLIKIFAWQMIHRNGIKREIKRLEIRLADLTQTIKSK